MQRVCSLNLKYETVRTHCMDVLLYILYEWCWNFNQLVWCVACTEKIEATSYHASVSLLTSLRLFPTPEALLVSEAGTLCKRGLVEAITYTEIYSSTIVLAQYHQVVSTAAHFEPRRWWCVEKASKHALGGSRWAISPGDRWVELIKNGSWSRGFM